RFWCKIDYMNNKNNQIKRNGILEFKYDMYDKDGNWMMGNGPFSISVGNNDLLPGLSDALIGLDYTIKKQTIDFRYYPNENNPSYKNVDLDLEIYSYNNHHNFETKEEHYNHTDQRSTQEHQNQREEVDLTNLDSKKMKNVKKEIKELQKEVANYLKRIDELNKNEVLLNKKIIDISKEAQHKIDEFKFSYKQRYANKLKETKDFQLQNFFEKFLRPLNNLYMAVEYGVNGSDNPEVVGYVKGFELLVNQMFSVIDDFGIEIIEPQKGDDFNPEFHNIVELIESHELEKDKIIEIKNRGYKLNGRVLIPANVSVSSNKSH
ncbi:MAG: nucleotide exchange factor GrpE, partial [Metamycoplasmataceae bacterium]